ncbi:Panacea domain-containing protein [Enterococcus sp. 22-H-5-01]|uniref:Panacea domain-containing protein n=1 Tax=Enterococcus sp. 22-H-5-01 TaxID=3418555 RepID=UPI003D028575
MAYHFIAISSYYEGGTRIGWHYASENQLDKDIIKKFLDESEFYLGQMEFGIHKLTTDSCEWKSVVEKDSFFKDVIIHEDKDVFFNLLKNDRDIDVTDIAKFFLSIGSITNLKLQKLIYFAYATYLNISGKKLFPEKIVAYKYGPVVEEVYQLYKGFGKEAIEDEDGPKFQLKDVPIPAPLAKIALSNSAKEILEALQITLNEYGSMTASELVEQSHVKGGPWEHAYDTGIYNCEITDEMIKNYHYKERKNF